MSEPIFIPYEERVKQLIASDSVSKAANFLTTEINQQIKALPIDDLKILLWDLAAFVNRDDQAFSFESSFDPPGFKALLNTFNDRQLFTLIRQVARLLEEKSMLIEID